MNQQGASVGLWPDTGHQPSYDLHLGDSPDFRRASITLSDGWHIHLPVTSEGVAYLAELAAALTQLRVLLQHSEVEGNDGAPVER